MSDAEREKAASPEDIPRLFRQFVAAKDFAGLATLYESEAVLALPAGEVTHGNEGIPEVFERVFAQRAPGASAGELQPVLISGDLALTSTRMADGRITAEIARKQADGSWRWVIDNPSM